MEWLAAVAPLAATTVLLVAAVVVLRRVLDDPSRRFTRGLTLTIVWVVGALAISLQLPIEPGLRGQVVGFLGVVLSAAVALGATTFVSQALAGVMLKVGRTFRRGDFIHVNDQFGRVTVRALFHTEIQTELRDLVILPNLYLVTNPVRVVQKSGTIVTTTVGLGYDVALSQIEELALEAAAQAGLEEPFVLVDELGDFSVTYRIGGLLQNPVTLISTRSTLRKQLLRVMHGAGVEIASPTLMNQRVFSTEHKFLFRPRRTDASEPEHAPEATAFDKADQAETVERLDELHTKLVQQVHDTKSEHAAATGEAKEAAAKRLAQLEDRLARLQEHRDRLEQELDS